MDMESVLTAADLAAFGEGAAPSQTAAGAAASSPSRGSQGAESAASSLASPPASSLASPPLGGELRPAAAGGRERQDAISAAAPLAARRESRDANGKCGKAFRGTRGARDGEGPSPGHNLTLFDIPRARTV